MDMSNKSLALLLVAAIVISLGGTLISLNKLTQTGATGLVPGQIYMGVSSNMSCNVDSNVSFGTGGQPSGWITIGTTKNNAAFSNYSDCTSVAACAGLQINNTGNVNINVTFNSSNDGATLLGGAVGDFNYSMSNGTSLTSIEPGCRAGLQTAWLAVPTTVTNICQNLTYNDTNDMMTIDFNVTIGPNTLPGGKTALMSINCAQN